MKFTILVTSKCNLKCKYCYEGSQKSSKDMTFNIADKTIEFIIDRLKDSPENRPLYIVFHGGEPLLNFSLIKYIHNAILEKVTDREVVFDMTTNGTIMNKEIISYIKKKIDSISISIDGTKYSHDLNRVFKDGIGSYDIVISNTKKLLSEGIKLRARMTFNSKNIEQLYEGVKSMLDMGFTYIVPAIDYYDRQWNEKHLEILENQVFKLLDYQKLYPSRHISLTELDFLTKKKGDCFGGINSYCIDERGKIYPCTYSIGESNFIIGNVENLQLIDSKINKLCKIYQSEIKECSGCTRYEYCIGTRCKIINKLITGKYKKPPAIVCAKENLNVKTIKDLIQTF